MKKKLLASLLAVATVATLSGCGNKDKASENGGQVTINVLSRYSSDQGPDDRVINQRIEKFMEENPDIKVVHEAIGDESTYNNMFKTAIATGDTPDVFVNYGGAQFQDYVESGLFLDLQKVMDEDKEWGDKYIPTMLDAWRFEGTEGVYGVPMACFATGLYYNKEIFEKNGLTPPKTVKEYDDVSKSLKSKGIIPMALGDKDNFKGAHLFANLILKRADFKYTMDLVEGKTKWDDPIVKEIFELMSDWQKKGYFGENVTTMEGTAEQSMFLNGETAMHLNGSWFMNQINDSDLGEKAGFIPFPYYEDYSQFKDNWHAGSSEGISLSANNTKEEQEASIKLLKYLTDDEAYNEIQELANGGIYPVTSMKQYDKLTPVGKDFKAAFVDVKDTKLELGEYGRNPQLREEIRDAIQGMFAGTSVEDTLNRIQKVVDSGNK